MIPIWMSRPAQPAAWTRKIGADRRATNKGVNPIAVKGARKEQSAPAWKIATRQNPPQAIPKKRNEPLAVSPLAVIPVHAGMTARPEGM